MVNDIIFADRSNFILTLDGIDLFLQNFKTIEPLNTEKWMIHPMEALVKLLTGAFTGIRQLGA